MRLKIKASSKVGGGTFQARFTGVEEAPTKFGPKLCWKFILASGTDSGKPVSGMWPLEPSINNKSGRYVSAVTGKPLTADEDVDLMAAIGAPIRVTIKDGFVSDVQPEG